MRTIVALLVVGVTTSPLRAQAAPSDQSPPPTVAASIVVSASLVEEAVWDSPATVHTVDRETIEARQSTEVVQLLRAIPGVTVAQSGGAGQQASLFIRGTESDQYLVLWNGVPLNNPYFGGFNWAFLPTEGVERVEVVSGPFSALYGSNATSGVVQIISRPDGIRGRVEGADDGSWRFSGAAAGARGPFSWEASGHVVRDDTEVANDDFAGEELAGRLAWSPERGQIALQVRANDSKTGIPFSGGASSPRRRIEWSEREWALPAHLVGDQWQLEGLLSQVRYNSDFFDPDDPFGFTESHTESQADRARAVASFELTPMTRLSTGGDWEQLEVNDSSSFGTALDGANQSTWALFSELGWRGQRWTASLGLRHDQNDVYGGQTSPRLGASFAATNQLQLRTSYGEAFRAPSIGELFFPFSGNPDLLPEESESFELGVRWQGERWSFDGAGFENNLTNLIDFDFATFTNVNIGRARTRGIEGEATLATGVVRTRLAATWLETEDLETGLPLLRRPEWSANVEITARPGNWTTNLLVFWVAERPDVDPVTFERATNPAYARADLAVRWSGWGGVAPYGRIENLADEEYEEALGFPVAGRRIFLGLAFGT